MSDHLQDNPRHTDAADISRHGTGEVPAENTDTPKFKRRITPLLLAILHGLIIVCALSFTWDLLAKPIYDWRGLMVFFVGPAIISSLLYLLSFLRRVFCFPAMAAGVGMAIAILVVGATDEDVPKWVLITTLFYGFSAWDLFCRWKSKRSEMRVPESLSRFLWLLFFLPHLWIAGSIVWQYVTFDSDVYRCGLNMVITFFVQLFFIPSAFYLLSFIHRVFSILALAACTLVPTYIAIHAGIALDWGTMVPGFFTAFFYYLSAIILFFRLEVDRAKKQSKQAKS